MASENTSVSNYELDKIFKKAKKIFFVGIGGISMSSLAEYCIYHGKSVFGYDRCRTEECRRLEKMAHIRYCSTTDSVIGMDLVIFSNAIEPDSFELRTARKMKIPTVSRANFLAYLTSGYKERIGVAGMHGKSTVTSMLAHIFRYAGKDPTVICGARMKEFSAPYRFGKRDFFIFEACEYMNSFLSFSPTDAVVTNIDFDHPDFFKDMSEVRDSFRQYVLSAKRVFVNSDDKESSYLSHPFKITFGIEKRADYVAKITSTHPNCFEILHKGRTLCSVTLKECGRHNVYNALCAFAVSCEHSIPHSTISTALSSFEGSERRQELVKQISLKNGHSVPLFLDYAHHPTEIRASLNAFCDMGYKKILCVFQAHTYSRTRALYSEFLTSFSHASDLVIAPVYSAREDEDIAVSDSELASNLGAKYISDYGEIANYVLESDADCIVIMGAGDIEKLKFKF